MNSRFFGLGSGEVQRQSGSRRTVPAEGRPSAPAYLRHLGIDYADLTERGLDFTIGGATVRYHAPLRFDDNAHAGARTEHLPPPRLGEHDASVRAWLDEKVD